MRAWVWLMLIALTTAARADELHARADQAIRETAHRVELRVVEGMALYRVRRTLLNEGAVAAQAHLAIALPHGGVAVGMRVHRGGGWSEAQLVDAERADAQYFEGAPDAPRRTPALLAWRDAGSLSLRVFPLEPRAAITIEYTLLAPTRYAHGRYWASYPRADTSSDDSVLAVPELRVRAAGRIEVEGVARRSGEPVALDNDAHRDFSLLGGNRDRGVGYAVSTLELAAPASPRATRALAVALELDHPTPEDLELELIGPGEQHYGLRAAGELAPLAKRYELEVSRDQLTGAWRLVASDHRAGDAGAIRRWSIASRDGADAFEGHALDLPVAIPDGFATRPDGGAQNEIAIVAPVAAPWVARYSHAPLGDGAAVMRLDLDVARKMSALPRRAQVVFVVDGSRSISDDDMARQTATIRQYLAHAPDAEAEVVVMRRHATRLFGRFLAAAPALATLARPGALEPGNGSALDEALALAAQAIAARPGPRRIVVMTDELLASRLAAPTVIAALARLAPEDVVHLVALTDPVGLTPMLLRREHGSLAPVAHAHHGLHVELLGELGGKAGADAVLELVRPTRLEGMRVVGAATEVTELREGEGLRVIERVDAPPKAIEITGALWSDPVALHVAPDARWTAQTAALVFGAPVHEALNVEQQATLAQRGRAVSPVTSYLVTGAGVRPADEESMTASCTCDASDSRSGYGRFAGKPPPPLRDLIDPAACIQRVRPAAGWRVALAIETTHSEIVDVTSTENDAMAACLIEAVWALRLPGSYGERVQHRVALGR